MKEAINMDRYVTFGAIRRAVEGDPRVDLNDSVSFAAALSKQLLEHGYFNYVDQHTSDGDIHDLLDDTTIYIRLTVIENGPVYRSFTIRKQGSKWVIYAGALPVYDMETVWSNCTPHLNSLCKITRCIAWDRYLRTQIPPEKMESIYTQYADRVMHNCFYPCFRVTVPSLTSWLTEQRKCKKPEDFIHSEYLDDTKPWNQFSASWLDFIRRYDIQYNLKTDIKLD